MNKNFYTNIFLTCISSSHLYLDVYQSYDIYSQAGYSYSTYRDVDTLNGEKNMESNLICIQLKLSHRNIN